MTGVQIPVGAFCCERAFASERSAHRGDLSRRVARNGCEHVSASSNPRRSIYRRSSGISESSFVRIMAQGWQYDRVEYVPCKHDWQNNSSNEKFEQFHGSGEYDISEITITVVRRTFIFATQSSATSPKRRPEPEHLQSNEKRARYSIPLRTPVSAPVVEEANVLDYDLHLYTVASGGCVNDSWELNGFHRPFERSTNSGESPERVE